MPQEDQPARTNEKTEPAAIRVTLPGEVYQRAGRWWWRVRLPGEDKARARPLKTPGMKAAASDLDAAEKVALETWEQAVKQEGARQITIECSQKVERLKAQFLDKVRHLTEICETANARAETEARARAETEARLNTMLRAGAQRTEGGGPRTAILNPPVSTACPVPAEVGFCECCGEANVSIADLTQIDSGQLLCSDCLNALRSDASRGEAHALTGRLG